MSANEDAQAAVYAKLQELMGAKLLEDTPEATQEDIDQSWQDLATCIAELITPDEWTTPEEMTNSWADLGGVYTTAAYRKDGAGLVHLKGVIAGGTVGQAAFTLPEGYRPLERFTFVALSTGATGRVGVSPEGNVVPESPSTSGWVSLDGIIFLGQQ